MPVVVTTGPLQGLPQDHSDEDTAWRVLPTREDLLSESASWREEVVGLVASGEYQIDDELISSLPSLRIVASYGVGVDQIDVQAAVRRGVWVTNLKGTLERVVAELAMALMLALVRRVAEFDRRVREQDAGLTERAALLSEQLEGKRLGLVGCGGIGREVARLGRAFGMSVAYTKRSRLAASDEAALGIEYLAKDALFSEVDILSLHCPLTVETQGYVDAKNLEKIKTGSYLVNTARAGLVDEEALLDALDDERMAGAGLDVYESPPFGSERLRRHPRVLLAPHVGSSTHTTRRRMTHLVMEQVRQALRGEAPSNLLAAGDEFVGQTKTSFPEAEH